MTDRIDHYAANEVRQEREFLQYRLSLKDTLMQMRDDMGLTSDDVPDLPQDPPLSLVQETSRAMGLRLYWSLMFEEDAP